MFARSGPWELKRATGANGDSWLQTLPMLPLRIPSTCSRLCVALFLNSHSERAARQWATVAMEWFGYELGADDDRVGGMRQIVAQPEDARGVWGSRDRENVGGPI